MIGLCAMGLYYYTCRSTDVTVATLMEQPTVHLYVTIPVLVISQKNAASQQVAFTIYQKLPKV